MQVNTAGCSKFWCTVKYIIIKFEYEVQRQKCNNMIETKLLNYEFIIVVFGTYAAHLNSKTDSFCHTQSASSYFHFYA